MKHASIIILCALATGLAVAGVAHVVVPVEYRSQYFMVKLLWAEFIVLVFWSYVAWYWRVNSAGTARSGATVRMVAGMGLVTFLFSASSALALAVFSIAGDGDAVNRAHLTVQIVMTAMFAVVWLLLGLSRQRTGNSSQTEVSDE
ncbi:MAG TPA: hypothetical protein P5295_13760 [Spirochaetota bacterium]|nr:hypothetical protein [Spirochaetota bacterium]